MTKKFLFLSLGLAIQMASPVLAQTTATPPPAGPRLSETVEGELSNERTVVAIPPLATASVQSVAGLRTDSLGRQIAEVIAADLERSGLYDPVGPGGVRAITRAEVQAPRFAEWQSRNAENVVHGFVDAGSNGSLIVG
ncbi:MAG: Tol-Pal system protein TolB, partial [Sphingopyxis sp.]|nr:Tol-Pal system protein TolB [Sphingopyxis sp.]